MFTFDKQGMYHACSFWKQNKSGVINVIDRFKYSTISNTNFWPVHTESVCLDLA